MIALTLNTLSYALAIWALPNVIIGLPLMYHWLEGHVS